MAKIVDHEARRKNILKKAITLIGQQGYDQVSYQQIAEACGLTRTTLYTYYKDKREIFDVGILYLVKEIGEEFQTAVHGKFASMDCESKLLLVSRKVIHVMLKSPSLMQNIMEYLFSKRRQGELLDRRILRHTVALRRTLKNLLREGIQKGEFTPVNLDGGTDFLYALFEATALRVMTRDHLDEEALLIPFRATIASLKTHLTPSTQS